MAVLGAVYQLNYTTALPEPPSWWWPSRSASGRSR
jgi:hypothetical protein